MTSDMVYSKNFPTSIIVDATPSLLIA